MAHQLPFPNDMNVSRLEYLFERFYDRTCSEAEKAEFKALLESDDPDEAVKAMIDRVLQQDSSELSLSPESSAAILQAVWDADPGAVTSIPRIHFIRTAWFRYAAAIVILIGVGTFIYRTTRSQRQIARQQPEPAPGMIIPGGSKAVLTLADGSKIVLDSVANGVLAQQGNMRVDKSANGQLAYHRSPNSTARPAADVYNTVTTPKGGQYQVILPDGSKAWLNAESSSNFPRLSPEVKGWRK